MKGLAALHVLAVAGIDADVVADVDEQGHHQGVAGLQGAGLVGIGGGVALEAGLGVGDFHLNEVGGGNAESGALEELHGHVGAFLNEGDGIFNLVVVQGQLLEGLNVHEVVQFAVVVNVLHFLGLDDGAGHLIGGVEGALNHSAGHHVLDLGADESRALAGLHVLEVNDVPHAAVPFNSNALLEIASSNHFFIPPSETSPQDPAALEHPAEHPHPLHPEQEQIPAFFCLYIRRRTHPLYPNTNNKITIFAIMKFPFFPNFFLVIILTILLLPPSFYILLLFYALDFLYGSGLNNK